MKLSTCQDDGAGAATHRYTVNIDTDAVLLIAAENAFNSMKYRRLNCHTIANYIIKCYANSSKLFIAGGGETLFSEGAAQSNPKLWDHMD